MKESISPTTDVPTFPYLDKVFQYGLLVIAFALLFVDYYHVSELLFVGLFIVWLAQKAFARSFKFEKTALDIPIFVFFCWVLLTVPFATDWTYSIEEWRKAIPRFLIFWFVVNVVNTEQQVRDILFSFSVGLLLLSVVESVNFFVQGGDPLSMNLRAGSLTGSSQWLSYYLVIGFPVLVLGVWCEDRPLARIIYIIAVSLALVALFLVHTRAAWVAVIVQGVFFLALKYTRNWMLAGVGVILGVVCLLLFLAIPGKHQDLIAASEFTHPSSMVLRFNTWEIAMNDIREHPLTGIGYGKHSFQRKHPNLGKGFHTHIHNSFLGRAVQIGIPGVLFFSWIFWVVLKKSSEWVTGYPDRYVGKLALAVFLMTVGLIVRSLFDDMISGTVVYIYMLLSGIGFSQFINLGANRKT